jgi:hypothetical protein
MNQNQKWELLGELASYPPLTNLEIAEEYRGLVYALLIDRAEQKFSKEIQEAQEYRINSSRNPIKALENYLRDNPKMKLNQFKRNLP